MEIGRIENGALVVPTEAQRRVIRISNPSDAVLALALEMKEGVRPEPPVYDAETQMLEESYTDADGVITVAYTAVDLPAPEDEGAGEDEL